MKSSISFLNKVCASGLLFLLFLLSGCAGNGRIVAGVPSLPGPVALLPVENTSGRPAPVADIRRMLAEELRRGGTELLDEEVLRRFMEKRRMRYTGGIDAATAEELRKETGAAGVLITCVDLYAEAPSPAVGLTLRLVRTGSPAVVSWMGGAAVSGDESPGLLGVGMVESVDVVARRATARVASSFHREAAGEKRTRAKSAAPPRVSYRAAGFLPGKGATVAVVPFLNRTDRKYAGEVVAMQLARGLGQRFAVVEPGELRQKLLQYRITLEEGVSLPTYDVLFEAVDADLVVTGEVTDFQEGGGAEAAPKVEFTVTVFERKGKRVVWSSRSSVDGDDGVWLFDWGMTRTAHELAAIMAEAVVRGLVD
jgi:hypothetical protein